MKKVNCVVVCGPTASGKTRLAVAIANKYNGEIISADSRQVYRGLDIGTGKDLHEYTTASGTVPFHCIDIADPSDVYTLFQFKHDFFSAFEMISSQNHLPILAGGTGLYIEAVLKNYDIPSIPENVAFRERMMQHEKEYLDSELHRIAPELYARTDRSSKKRIVRAIEIATFANSESFSVSHDEGLVVPVVLCTRFDRAELHERIDTRLHQRLEQGMTDEVKHLLGSGLSEIRLKQLGMEYKHITRYLTGETDKDTMINTLKRDIHQLAKRQQTWFRGMERRGIQIHWIDNCNVDYALDLLDSLLMRGPKV